MPDYGALKHAYHRAMGCCDPIEYAARHKCLLLTIAAYLLERDKPHSTEEELSIIQKVRQIIGRADDSFIE